MYQITQNQYNQNIIIKNDIYWIPFDETNIDYQEYLKWLEEGNEPEEWNPTPSEEEGE